MPRIEIIPENWETSTEKAQGDGSPTVDICKKCWNSNDINEGDPVDENFPSSEFNNGTIGSTEVDNPSYEDGEYTCECCNEILTSEDE